MSRASLADTYKNLSILIVMLMSPCLLLDELTASTGIPFIIRFGILFNLFALALLSLGSQSLGQISRSQKLIIVYLIIGIGYFFLIGVTIYPGTGYTTKTPIKNFAMTIMIIFIINRNRFNLKSLLNLYIYLAFVLSGLAIIQYLMHILNISELQQYYLKTYSVGDMRYIGLGGFIDPDYMRHNFYRVESFWREPSRFAQFLQVPIFFLIHRYFTDKSIKNIILLSTTLAAFILTYSVANYFSLMVGLLIFFALTKSHMASKYRVLKRINNYLILIAIAYSILTFYNFTNDASSYSSSSILGKKTTKQIKERVERFVFASSVLDVSVFGDPSIRDNWRRNPSAIGMMFVWGGVPGVLIVIMMAFGVLKKIITSMRRSRNGIIYAGIISFFIAFNWYGSYFEMNYLLLLAIFTQIMKHDPDVKDYI